MPCASFEDLLLDYEELAAAARETVDAHVAVCPACREYLETLAEMDGELASWYAGARAPAAFRSTVLSRARSEVVLPKPSFLPEVLDFIGWSAIMAIVGCLVPLFVPLAVWPQLPTEWFTLAAGAAAAVAFLAAIWTGVRSDAEMER